MASIHVRHAATPYRPPCGQRGKGCHATALVAAEVTVDLPRWPIWEEFVGEAIGKQKALASGMQEIHFLGVPVGFGTTCAERQHAHVNQRREAPGYDILIQISSSALAHGCVIDQDVGACKLALQRSLAFWGK